MSNTQLCKSNTTAITTSAEAILSLGRKAFYLQPAGLSRYVCGLGLSATVQQIFWYHWSVGYMGHSTETQIPINQVASELSISPRTVERAYQQLVDANLIQRVAQTDETHGGRGVTLTRIVLPSDALAMLNMEPDRLNLTTTTAGAMGSSDQGIQSDIRVDDKTLTPSDGHTDNEPKPAPIAARLDGHQAIAQRMAEIDADIEHLNAALSQPNSLGLNEFRAITEQIVQAKAARERLRERATTLLSDTPPSKGEPPKIAADPLPDETQPTAIPATTPVRRISTESRERIANRVSEIPRVSNPSLVIDEVIYSIEQGAQASKPIPLAINAAIKMVRLNSWRTPRGMPNKSNTYNKWGRAVGDTPQIVGGGVTNCRSL